MYSYSQVCCGSDLDMAVQCTLRVQRTLYTQG
jgi:hypothetical protein